MIHYVFLYVLHSLNWNYGLLKKFGFCFKQASVDSCHINLIQSVSNIFLLPLLFFSFCSILLQDMKPLIGKVLLTFHENTESNLFSLPRLFRSYMKNSDALAGRKSCSISNCPLIIQINSFFMWKYIIQKIWRSSGEMWDESISIQWQVKWSSEMSGEF